MNVGFDLNNLSLKELKDLQGQIEKAIVGYNDRRKKEALADLEERARSLGFSLSELTGIALPRKRTAAAAKYANPANAADTWTGRGRKPRWFEEAIASGLTPEELEL